MKNRFVANVALLALATMLSISTSFITAQTRDKAEAALKAADDKATIDGDLRGAIEMYKKIAESKDRALAAKALLRMAEAYQKLGDTESLRIYQRIATAYQDQREAAALARQRLAGGATSSAMHSKLVLSGDEVDTEGSVSADGRYASFTDWDTGDLAIHEFATGANRHLHITANKETKYSEFAEGSAISRDGKLIVYNWSKKGGGAELRIANMIGDANPQVLYANPEFTWFSVFDWSPDGKSIAVEAVKRDRTKQIALVSVPTKSLQSLRSVDWQSVGRIFFSPDGRWLAYDLPSSLANPERDVFVLSVDGARETHAVDHRGNDELVGWSPDGKWLLFSSDRTGSNDLWAVSFHDGVSQDAPQLLKSGFERSTAIGMTRSGVLYYVQVKGGEGSSTLQIASADMGAGKIGSPVDLPKGYADSNVEPKWSPDGKQLAYVSQRGPRGARSYVLVIRSTIDPRQVRELQPQLNPLNLDSWTPDERSVLAFGADSKGQYGPHLIDVEAADITPLATTFTRRFVAYNGSVSWAPDGRSFLMQEGTGKELDLYRVDITTGNATKVMPLPAGQLNFGLYAKWSPDGTKFYYHRHFESKNPTNPADAEFALIERNISTGTERELMRRPFRIGNPFVIPGGQYILTPGVDSATNSRVLRLIPTAGGEAKVLMSVSSEAKPEALNDTDLGQFLFPRWLAPDGRSIMVVKRLGDRVGCLTCSKQPSEVWLVPLNGGERRKIGTVPVLTEMGVSPDGLRAVFITTDVAARRTAEVWALENFLPKPTAVR